MAVAQSQKKYDNLNEKALINDAEELKQKAFRNMDPTLLHHLHQNQNDHVSKNGSNIFALTGGERSRKLRQGPKASKEAIEEAAKRLNDPETRLEDIQ